MASKLVRRSEKRLKEILLQVDDERRNTEQFKDQVSHRGMARVRMQRELDGHCSLNPAHASTPCNSVFKKSLFLFGRHLLG